MIKGGEILDRPNPKQNIVAEYFGMKVKLQFDFCPKCKYFKSCYSTDGNPHYLSEECLRDYEDGIYDDYEVTNSIKEENFTEQISVLNKETN